jgi:hypothetical protein
MIIVLRFMASYMAHGAGAANHDAVRMLRFSGCAKKVTLKSTQREMA